MDIDAVQASALDMLTDIVERYLRDAGRVAHDLAEHTGRTSVNALDIFEALDVLNVNMPGFYTYVQKAAELPFTKALPEILPCPSASSVFVPVPDEEAAKAPKGQEHIPPFLPPFPPEHTFKATEVEVEPDIPPAEQARQQRQQIQDATSALVAFAPRQDAFGVSVAPPATQRFGAVFNSATAAGDGVIPGVTNRSHTFGTPGYSTFHQPRGAATPMSFAQSPATPFTAATPFASHLHSSTHSVKPHAGAVAAAPAAAAAAAPVSTGATKTNKFLTPAKVVQGSRAALISASPLPDRNVSAMGWSPPPTAQLYTVNPLAGDGMISPVIAAPPEETSTSLLGRKRPRDEDDDYDN
eukprot:TRINITY_DN3683_c0_g1_i1.p1 TRINITY_DN3683_c0_g1~~TRINITY_DN3683_c0_g1_i1.p1  ORF type:complete len:354 (+),score=64.41 TRINITY_DN3683_c0_g1_i1:150-1211(+)